MASISPPTFASSTRSFDRTFHKLTYATPKFSTASQLNNRSTYSSTLLSHPLSRVSKSTTLCRCQKNNDEGNNTDNGSPRGWDSALQENFRNVIKWFDDYISRYRIIQPENLKAKTDDSGGGVETEEGEMVIDRDEDWNWGRWEKHFAEIDKQELIVSILETQLHRAVLKEDYEEASRIKVAIAAAASNDTVGMVMSQLNKALKEERYKDAAFVRDHASAGLVGWWAGFSDDRQDPYGRIIHIRAKHGRYLARSYTPRQLAKGADGDPLFEVFITMNEKGESKHQAVYLKQSEDSRESSTDSATSSGLTDTDTETDTNTDTETDTDTDTNDFENFIRMIPGVKDVKIKVMNVTSLEKIDMDLISKVVEQIIEEEYKEEDETESDTELDSDIEKYDIDDEGHNSQIFVDIDLREKVSSDKSSNDLIRLPAKLEKKSRSSFTFKIEKENQKDSLGIKREYLGHKDSAKSIEREKIPLKVIKDVTQLINLTLGQGQNRQSLSGSTTFNRIELPLTEDPLNGLYVGGHGIYTSEIIKLNRKFGQWKEDGNSNLEFYEYVEAVKITGDQQVPPGEVAFRAKVGTKYQLPHRGLIPEEFGVIARYKGQGRLADPGFQNPKWVDGELVILDGKHINGDPLVGFVYFAPENNFLVLFNQLKLQE